MDKQQKLLSSRLFNKQTEVEVVLSRTLLSWREIQPSHSQHSDISTPLDTAVSQVVQVSEIVSVQKTEGWHPDTSRTQSRAKEHKQLFPYVFTVSYVRRGSKHQWRCSDVEFLCPDQITREQWIRAISDQLTLLTNRPKSLLVYINPFGGKKQGKWIYDQKVAPLFHKACISTDVIVTEEANHARNHLETEANLDKYDGVVCVGGDGMFSEIVHGLVTRTQGENKVDLNDSEAELTPCALRIGIIPAGSTDCICFSTVGTNDPVTSALHIIVGDSQPMDVCSVHHNSSFLRLFVSLLGYGFYGDVLTESERKRWLGPARYDLAGVKTFLNHNYYDGTVSFLPAEDNTSNPRDKLQCRSGCGVCQLQSSSKAIDVLSEKKKAVKDRRDGWTVLSGKFMAINAACMSCACPRSPKGLSPSAHLADGTTDLILVRKCSRINFFKHLLRHTNKDDQFDHVFVEVHRVKKFRFQPHHTEVNSLEDLSEIPKNSFRPICAAPSRCNYGSSCSSWTCDGEILPHNAIQVSVQPQLIRLFARGIEETQQQFVFEDP